MLVSISTFNFEKERAAVNDESAWQGGLKDSRSTTLVYIVSLN